MLTDNQLNILCYAESLIQGVASSPEFQSLDMSPDFTLVDAIAAINEVVDHHFKDEPGCKTPEQLQALINKCDCNNKLQLLKPPQ